MGTSHSKNFVGVVELLGMFGLVMQDHLQKIQKKKLDCYLRKRIQTELINIIGQAGLQ